ncbi:MAG: efflux RND transporter permease subunit [Candidatus Krumholzibacteriota bacterium]|nr:efflux RND transporter permease subunit [Candidatus Krumholzibacteriota bacterium]
MKNISRFSVDHPVTVLMIVLAVLLLGYISFRKLGIDLFPDLNNPRLFIELRAGEQPPEEIERQYIDALETMASRKQGVIAVYSAIQVGTAQTVVEYGWDTDMDEAFLDLQKGVTETGQNSEDIDEITISQHDPNTDPIMLIGFSHAEITDMDKLRTVAENYIRNELTRLEGIAGVEIAGQEEKEVIIETDAYLLEAYGLNLDAVAAAITSYNQNVSGGSITEMGLEYLVKGVGVFESLEDISNIILSWKDSGSTSTGGGQDSGTEAQRIPVFLKDVAAVRYLNREPESIVRINGRRCLGLSVYKEMKFNTVQASTLLRRELEKLQRALPGYEFQIIQDQGRFITNAIDEVKQTALLGILMAILVLYLFLRRIGTTAIVSVAIPISVVATFNLMYFNGLSLNIMTLGGLALGAGMLVDNAIVVMENIIRNLEAGLDVREASIAGASQVSGAITASTITTVVVFLPIVYLHGASGELFKDQAWTVAFSLLSSLVVAMLVIPMLSSRFLGRKPRLKTARSVRLAWYGGALEKVLGRRGKVIGAAAALVVLALLLIPVVGSEFIPRGDMKEFTLQLRLSEGTELKRTESTVGEIEKLIRALLGEEVETIYSHVGPSSGIGGGVETIFQNENTASLKIRLKNDSELSPSRVTEILGAALSALPDIDAQFIQDQTALLTTLGSESAPIAVEISGEDLAVLEEITSRIKEKLAAIDDLFNVETSLEGGRPEVEIVVDRLRAGMYELDVSDISSQLQDLLQGRDAGYWDHEGEKKDITLKVPEQSLGDLAGLVLRKNDQRVRLSDVSDIRHGYAPKEINRRNQVRTGTVTAHQKKGRPFNHVIGGIRQQLSSLDVPPGYKLRITGEEEKRQAEFRDLRFALILSIVLVYMVLASQFESLIHPFTILLTIPLAGVGAILIFFLLGKSLNIMAYIGIIMLVGIAVNDSIILVDAINKLQQEGLERKKAILEAGQRRIRPIIMTSATTILALAPLTLGFGEGAALRAPMALAVIGGLITSTILTLFVIPCVYSLLDRIK